MVFHVFICILDHLLVYYELPQLLHGFMAQLVVYYTSITYGRVSNPGVNLIKLLQV